MKENKNPTNNSTAHPGRSVPFTFVVGLIHAYVSLIVIKPTTKGTEWAVRPDRKIEDF